MSISAIAPSPASITWTQLHTAIVQALRHVEPGSPAYITADVLTDELLDALSSATGTAPAATAGQGSPPE
ncbi:hypothetical protein [Pseudarthrobacter sp. Y6]|uniref:hypothetical protein n=1 Tax=Pseudarthrobacter sp. Y6 TaxID=3418422 RepID=UPI003CE69EF7